jgi:hypothetical protein
MNKEFNLNKELISLREALRNESMRRNSFTELIFGNYVYIVEADDATASMAKQILIDSFEYSETFNQAYERTSDYKFNSNNSMFMPMMVSIKFTGRMKPTLQAYGVVAGIHIDEWFKKQRII